MNPALKPALSTNLAAMLSRIAGVMPDATAIYLGTRPVQHFAGLADRVARGARGLLERYGLKPGDRVALVLRNGPQYVELLYAIWHAGLCAVPINAKLHPLEVAGILENAGAALCLEDEPDAEPNASASGVCRLAVSGPDYEALFAGAPLPLAEVSGQALAWLFYTSGTTGKPKGVMLSHHNLTAMAFAYASGVGPVVPGDSLIHAAPMSHGSGLYLIPYLAEGAAQVIPVSGGFDPAEMAELIAAHAGSEGARGQQSPGPVFFAAPTMLNRLVRDGLSHGRNLSGLKRVVCGGAPLYREDLVAALICLGPKVAQIYGQGESPMTITAQSPAEIADLWHAGDGAGLTTVGRPAPGVELRIADGEDEPLPPGQVGEILVRGATVMQGYWQHPTATAATLRHGWLHTGDVGCLDAAGRLTLKDRSKDVIISGGSNIYPREVEDVLLAHPGVAEVSVLGRPHPDWGEEVVAVVVALVVPLKQSPAEAAVSESGLDAWCLERIARFKRPKAYVFVDELPKNSTGKVLKTVLRARLGSG